MTINLPSLARETIHYTTHEAWLALRVNDLTSTDMAALFDESPYCTPFELWHRKKQNVVSSFKMNDRVAWGTRLQDSIAAGVAADMGWTIRRSDEYMRLPDLRIGSSFDFRIVEGTDEPDEPLEIKNVDSLAFRDGWVETEFGIEAPTHIEVQLQVEMLAAGKRRAKIAALVGGNRVVILERELDVIAREAIMERAAAFWRSIDANEEPSPDFHRDLATLSKLYGYAEPDKVINADERMIALMQHYRYFSQVESQAKEEKQARKAELLTLIGDAEKVLAPGLSISASMIASTQVQAYERKAYRDFRVLEKRKPK